MPTGDFNERIIRKYTRHKIKSTDRNQDNSRENYTKRLSMKVIFHSLNLRRPIESTQAFVEVIVSNKPALDLLYFIDAKGFSFYKPGGNEIILFFLIPKAGRSTVKDV